MARGFAWRGWPTLTSLVTAVAAIAALGFTAQSLRATRDQIALTEQGQLTDRFGRAVEQLGSEKVDVRLGGVHALERLAGDSERDRPTVHKLLAAFVREHAPLGSCPAEPDRARRPPTDVQAALTVLAHRNPVTPPEHLDLTRTCLAGARITGGDLSWALFDGANLTHADLEASRLDHASFRDADLTHVDLRRAHLGGASFLNANLSHGLLFGANLSESHLGGANLRRADLRHANLRRASLLFASLPDARLVKADLTDLDLSGADLTGADLSGADLTGVDLGRARTAPPSVTPTR
ncbi:Pentapeptide repeat-containing protein [Streptoalloteichus tenebrarius]|uniref:Pentapeptide repeat-containing protein n=1 Tax=Streptoalloteichus tenebrarius (strain ATCC 17920 / DSM 40477 / JCM 4838 / CBS 697.72 / NBRC 16177 / NCIMB 11028 / NRRL B-12390 / A12253. 1 / ISP 5477) TaxID=1933 RepID=A0ABT1HPD7_STRSD|nr:pentapeptide repeat-containing protein [Streptoalloteichus tenebrarius]MCP2257370.1 Pentapeptide repeat-containing protein [Streptoalloteichus tenebrarius]